MGEDALAYVGNEGARASRIIRSLRSAHVAQEQRTLLEPIFQGGR
jgi:hypothetical protein